LATKKAPVRLMQILAKYSKYEDLKILVSSMVDNFIIIPKDLVYNVIVTHI
jgi:hypothetical protein